MILTIKLLTNPITAHQPCTEWPHKNTSVTWHTQPHPARSPWGGTEYARCGPNPRAIEKSWSAHRLISTGFGFRNNIQVSSCALDVRGMCWAFWAMTSVFRWLGMSLCQSPAHPSGFTPWPSLMVPPNTVSANYFPRLNHAKLCSSDKALYRGGDQQKLSKWLSGQKCLGDLHGER